MGGEGAAGGGDGDSMGGPWLGFEGGVAEVELAGVDPVGGGNAAAEEEGGGATSGCPVSKPRYQ